MMKKVKVVLCSGTTCYVMGSSHLALLEEHLLPEERDLVEVFGARCLDLCKNDRYGGAPYVLINDQIMAEATLPEVLERIRALLAD
jgi:NADH:ubiquinone oxidoreductase subunit E